VNITGFKQSVKGQYIPKDPDAQLTYTVDWTDWLIDSDTLSVAEWAVSTISGDANPLTVEANGIVTGTQQAYVELSGGTAGEIYEVKNTITTTDGAVDVRRFKVKVENRYL
jgi:hypothetical protein